MFSHQVRKYIRSFHLQKYRQKYNKFIAEGPKIAGEILSSEDCKIVDVVCTSDWFETHRQDMSHKHINVHIVNEKELKSVSGLKTPHSVLLLCEQMPVLRKEDIMSSAWSLYCCDLQDPGNLGTIIRTADWFGVKNIMLSPHSCNFYNPKVIQSSMGSFLRVRVGTFVMSDLDPLKLNFIALALDGLPIHNLGPQDAGVIVLGNESSGLDKDLLQKMTHRVSIPARGQAESLNVAVACGIALDRLVGYPA